jgi:hypothetical protein
VVRKSLEIGSGIRSCEAAGFPREGGRIVPTSPIPGPNRAPPVTQRRPAERDVRRGRFDRADGTILRSATDPFSWQAATDAGHYSLEVVDSASGAAAVLVPNVTGTTYPLNTTQAKASKRRRYTWYMTAVSTNGKASVRRATANLTL